MLRVMIAPLRPGHLSVRAGDSSRRSEEISNCAFQCDHYHHYMTTRTVWLLLSSHSARLHRQTIDRLSSRVPISVVYTQCETARSEEVLNATLKIGNVDTDFLACNSPCGAEGFRDSRPRQGVVLFVGCLTSQQHASVSQGRICSNNFTCCHTDTEVADQTFHLTQSILTTCRPVPALTL